MDDMREKFIDATFRLSRMHPDTWSTFVEAFQAYASGKCVEAVRAPVETLARATGIANGLLALSEDFKKISPLFEQLDEVRKKRQSRQPGGR